MSWPTDISIEEAVYQALAAADAIQTSQLSRQGYHEVCIDAIIGRRPSASSTFLWFGGMGLGHLLVTNSLIRWGHPQIARLFEGVSIGIEGQSVAWNLSLGVKF